MIFVIEIIALVVLAAGIFLFARLNVGLGGIGSAGTAGTVTTGGGTVTGGTAAGGAPAAATPDPNFDADAAEGKLTQTGEKALQYGLEALLEE